MSLLLHAPQFSGRVPVQFISDDAPSLSITASQNPLFNNPKIFMATAGNAAKLVPVVDGTSKIGGQGEFAPFSLDIEWDEMGYNDYLNLVALQPYKVTFISFRNIGYYGAFILNGPASPKPNSSDIVQCKMTFFVLGPSDDGGAVTVHRVGTPPSMSITQTAGAGYIQANTNAYYFLTFHTKWGESTYYVFQYVNGSSSAGYANNISWTWPVNTHCTYASLYCGPNNDSNPAHALLMGEVLRGSPASWTDMVGFQGISPPGVALYQTPPLVDQSYSGQFQGGVWINQS